MNSTNESMAYDGTKNHLVSLMLSGRIYLLKLRIQLYLLLLFKINVKVTLVFILFQIAHLQNSLSWKRMKKRKRKWRTATTCSST